MDCKKALIEAKGDIVEAANILKKKGKFKINYKKIKKFNIKSSLSKKMNNKLKIKFDKYYLLKTLKKYYK